MAVAGIHISLSADSKGFRSELTKARREINGFSDRSRASFKRFSGDSTRSLNRVQSSFRNTGTAATTLQAALRPLLALFTVAAFTAFVKGAFDAASAIKAAAGAAGLCAVELQKWQYALQGTGVAVSETDRALRTFGVRLG